MQTCCTSVACLQLQLQLSRSHITYSLVLEYVIKSSILLTVLQRIEGDVMTQSGYQYHHGLCDHCYRLIFLIVFLYQFLLLQLSLFRCHALVLDQADFCQLL